MAEKSFRTDRFTFLGYTLLVLTYTLFFGTIVYRSGGFSFKSLIMVLLIIPVAVYFFFLLKKRIIIDDTGIKVVGITGEKKFKWEEISEVSVSTGRRYLLFIADKDGNVAVVDDSTENFKELLEELKNRLPQSNLPPNYEEIIKSYKRSYGSLTLIYIASFILLFVLIRSLI